MSELTGTQGHAKKTVSGTCSGAFYTVHWCSCWSYC